ncbi:aldolase/citrate lyase family protein [Methylobacterium sp. 10]|uniref:aldolase/citrate lyase family protein n=1 Tax=Methylobacterium sp. 10 TaxID=1101191 RepID=UPI0004801B67|nr:aldolase/citrate lyase family protein [Methylobacterium sp. 10]
MRAVLIVPGEAQAVAAASASGAHALIVDVTGLASPVLPSERTEGAPLLYLRSHDLERDLPAMMAAAPHGIVLPRCEGARDVMELGARLAVGEAIQSLRDGATRILALVTTARGALVLPTLADSSDRLDGIAWDARALRTEIGASAFRGRDGALIPPLAETRALVRLAATAAGVDAIDSACEPGGDLAGEIEEASRDGFAGKLVLDPVQARIVAMTDFTAPSG